MSKGVNNIILSVYPVRIVFEKTGKDKIFLSVYPILINFEKRDKNKIFFFIIITGKRIGKGYFLPVIL